VGGGRGRYISIDLVSRRCLSRDLFLFLFLDRRRSQVFASHEHNTTDHIHRRRRRERRKPRRSRMANAETLREARRHACMHASAIPHTYIPHPHIDNR
jgi:hypothetical protein